jgi:AAA+ superfamily predicted ATPase
MDNPKLPDDLFLTSLYDNAEAIPLRFESQLREHLPDISFLATQSLAIGEYVELGYATASVCQLPFPNRIASWGGLDHDQLFIQPVQAVWRIQWQSQVLHVMLVSWTTSCGGERRYWVLAETESVAHEFILDVARKTNDPGKTVLVFRDGYWDRSSDMFEMVQSTSMDELILPGNQRQSMIDDFQRFLKSRAQYESLGLAWRRGAILLGPPGNGKTHFLRALVHELDVPCLYVQSLAHPYLESEQLLDKVFDRARQLRPCVLIFEDLDSLIDEDNRAYFLNQLDGFEKNQGVIIVATTNHAERIDPAILDRPSRFDRKYEFRVPCVEDRHRFLELWRDKLLGTIRWDGGSMGEAAEATEGFSFAYMKELIISSLLEWLHGDNRSDVSRRFEEILLDQCRVLQAQRRTTHAVAENGGDLESNSKSDRRHRVRSRRRGTRKA